MLEESVILMLNISIRVKKSIDLTFKVWQRLSALSQRRGLTLSETIVQLIEDAERKEQYALKST